MSAGELFYSSVIPVHRASAAVPVVQVDAHTHTHWHTHTQASTGDVFGTDEIFFGRTDFIKGHKMKQKTQ